MTRYCSMAALLLLISSLMAMPVLASDLKMEDMNGRAVTINKPVENVITAGYCLLPCIISALGEDEKIIATSGAILGGANETIATIINPKLKDLPNLGSAAFPVTLNVEAAAALSPDLILLEKDCAGQGDSSVAYDKLIDTLNLLNDEFPTVSMNNQACSSSPDITLLYKEIELCGEIFDKQQRAAEIIAILDEEVNMVRNRTRNISEEDKPKVLFMALQGGLDSSKGAVGSILPDYDCGTLYPNITQISNAYTGKSRSLMSAEQLLAIDPEVIIIVCSRAGFESSKIYNEEYYKGIQEIKAVREKKVYSTGMLEFWRNLACLEIPIELLIEAKSAYPDRFADVSVDQMLTDHCKKLYGLDDRQIQDLKETMGLDWMDKSGF
ncbi:MAG: Periplasmic binding protein [Methanosaeta sp. PtaU1.Bin112]|nr:MAG: Periplasmic binding protein [Methanosaeta sp. PtaU1.Bin112]